MNWRKREDNSGKVILYCSEFFASKDPFDQNECRIVWFVASHRPYLLMSGDYPMATADLPGHWIFI